MLRSSEYTTTFASGTLRSTGGAHGTAIRNALHRDGVFPIVDYFNAFDFVVCFGKQAVFVPHPRRFEDQSWRIDNCRAYRFSGNGADQLVGMLRA